VGWLGRCDVARFGIGGMATGSILSVRDTGGTAPSALSGLGAGLMTAAGALTRQAAGPHTPNYERFA